MYIFLNEEHVMLSKMFCDQFHLKIYVWIAMHIFPNSGVEIRNLGYTVLFVDVSFVVYMYEFIVI